jgi:leader peptidase (prepilin peptidase)/N-methyltransferase
MAQSGEWAIWLSPWVLGALGLCIGSFLNVVAHRLPRMMERQWWRDVAQQLSDGESFQRTFGRSAPKPLDATSGELEQELDKLGRLTLSKPASRCPACNHRIRWHENIPLVSWLRLRGRCSACGTRISARYPLLELSTGLLFAGIAWQVGPQPVALAWCGVAATLVALTAIDWDTTLLPDALTLPLLWAGRWSGRCHSAPRSGVLWWAICRCGRCTGCSS